MKQEELTIDEENKILNAYRAGGDVICSICGKTYYKHKLYIPSGKTNDGEHHG